VCIGQQTSADAASRFRIRLMFAYNSFVFDLPPSRFCDYTIRCKGCGENIPAPVETMPDYWVITTCPLCGERRRYLPSEIFSGRLSYLFDRWRDHKAVI